jgi:hypothetical protein
MISVLYTSWIVQCFKITKFKKKLKIIMISVYDSSRIV